MKKLGIFALTVTMFASSILASQPAQAKDAAQVFGAIEIGLLVLDAAAIVACSTDPTCVYQDADGYGNCRYRRVRETETTTCTNNGYIGSEQCVTYNSETLVRYCPGDPDWR